MTSPQARRRPIAVSDERLAFTLVELLVVIGIIAILVGILLPTLAGARKQAEMVKCSSNLRQLTTAMLMHAQDHQGFMPLMGNLWVDTTLPNLATQLNDSARKKYVYVQDPRYSPVESLPPAVMSVAKYIAPAESVGLDWTDSYKLDLQVNGKSLWSMWMCPSTDGSDRGIDTAAGAVRSAAYPAKQQTMIATNTTGGLWSSNTDYGFNEAVFGFAGVRGTATGAIFNDVFARGKVSKVRGSTKTAILFDSSGRRNAAGKAIGAGVSRFGSNTFPDSWIGLTLDPGKQAGKSLTSVPFSEAFAPAASNRFKDAYNMWDLVRHKTKGGARMNIAFLDGHVETRECTAKANLDIYVIAPK